MTKEPFRPPSKNLPIQAQPSLEEEIRRRAYEIYKERGCEPGHGLDDWVRAEAEVSGGVPQNLAA